MPLGTSGSNELLYFYVECNHFFHYCGCCITVIKEFITLWGILLIGIMCLQPSRDSVASALNSWYSHRTTKYQCTGTGVTHWVPSGLLLVPGSQRHMQLELENHMWSSDLQVFSTCWVSSSLPGKLAKIAHVGRGQIGKKKGKILQEMENYLTGHLSLFKLWKTLELFPRLQHSYHLLLRWPLFLSWQHWAFIRSIFGE